MWFSSFGRSVVVLSMMSGQPSRMGESVSDFGPNFPHFSRREFACHHCGQVKVATNLLESLERLRAIKGGRPLRIVSGYRCPVHNAQVGGAKASRHLVGDAADIPYGYATVAEAERAGFQGIGDKNGFAIHVDRRPRRARWHY